MIVFKFSKLLLFQKVTLLGVVIFINYLQVDATCDSCPKKLNAFCCERPKEVWRNSPGKKICCDFTTINSSLVDSPGCVGDKFWGVCGYVDGYVRHFKKFCYPFYSAFVTLDSARQACSADHKCTMFYDFGGKGSFLTCRYDSKVADSFNNDNDILYTNKDIVPVWIKPYTGKYYCALPFKFNGRTYDKCTTKGSLGGLRYWCATQVNSDRTLKTKESYRWC